ncbi:ComEC/Rec2 family competence protein [Rhabdaerophilum sp. SD176]|uniref:ComEC/Rec2 family competence protein n=1 Tax=Rhabdaerophilum sp. SD176 TaxID=2983548 RepID=UPI0024DF52C1|nr:ComEC/Rec2 family competence protein [Rhabdaerophilum sp. SD176]
MTPRVTARPAVLPAGPAPLALPTWSRLPAILSHCLAQEASRRTGFLWFPVAYGVGILAYFSLPAEPSPWAAPILATLLTVLAGLAGGGRRWFTLLALMASLGMMAGSLRTALVAAPVASRALIADVQGHIETIEFTPQRSRILLRVHKVEGLAPAETPYRVKIGLPGQLALPTGSAVTLRASLAPPAGAALPGGFDFRREAFFRGIGAIGFAIGPVRPWAEAPPPPAMLARLAQLDEARNLLTRRIAGIIEGPAGAVTAALVTGKRGLIPDEANDALRLSGLYHIVSISGLHMVLAAGVLFWSIRAGLALSTRLALRWPIRKMAALGAMLGATAYCLFAGSEVATIRSLVMTLVMLGAILLDRPALAMRNLALSALLVLTFQPEALLGPSFQMSYAAVAALIAAQGLWRPGRPETEGENRLFAGWPRRILAAFAGIVITTIVASLATAPFAAYHFYRVNPFGLIGNALGIPLVSLVVMPAAVAGSLLYPFGLDEPVWRLMGHGIRGVMAVAEWVSGFDKASLPAPLIRHSQFGALVLAMALLILPVSRLRALAIGPFALWLASLAMPARPDLIVHENGRILLARGEGGAYRVLAFGPSPDFVLGQWLPALGDPRLPKAPDLKNGVRCDRLGCTLRLADGRWLAFPQRPEALREDCARADILVTPLENRICPPDRVPVDGRTLRQQGTLWLWAKANGSWRIEGTRAAHHHRPWQRLPAENENRPKTGADNGKAGPAPDLDRDEGRNTEMPPFRPEFSSGEPG